MLSAFLPLFSSILLAIALIVTTLGMPLVSDHAKFWSLLSVAVYPIDCLTASLTAPWLLDCLTAWLPDFLSKYYYPILALRARTFALCDYTTTWEILWRKTLYRAKTLVLLYTQWKKKKKNCTICHLKYIHHPALHINTAQDAVATVPILTPNNLMLWESQFFLIFLGISGLGFVPVWSSLLHT